jgi:hypothetical protein
MNRGSSTLILLLYSCRDYDVIHRLCYIMKILLSWLLWLNNSGHIKYLLCNTVRRTTNNFV